MVHQFQPIHPLPAAGRAVPNLILSGLRFASLYKVPAATEADAFLSYELHSFMTGIVCLFLLSFVSFFLSFQRVSSCVFRNRGQ